MLLTNVLTSTHSPSTQTWPNVQAVPHAPQFQKSLRRSAQPLPQRLRRPQFATQVAWTQACPGAHTVPQVPQLLRSLLVLAGRPAQTCMGGVVVKVVHAPSMQEVPEGQVTPREPQLFGSVKVATQVELTWAWPVGHAAVQVPA